MIGAILNLPIVRYVVDGGALLRRKDGFFPVRFHFIHKTVDETGRYFIVTQTFGGFAAVDDAQSACVQTVALTLAGAVMTGEFVLAEIVTCLK